MTEAQPVADASTVPRPYVADKPSRRPSAEELRARIPGWGADLDPRDRPAFPREVRGLDTGAHWDLPTPQEDLVDRERSIEHGMLPPVYGTVAPLHGVSGLIRGIAYKRFSEARLAHWLLLIAGDRVDAFGAHVGALLSGDPGTLVSETGIEVESNAEVGTQRADRSHRWIDPILVTGPWIATAWIGWRVLRGVLRRTVS